jgi:hypothetical protein
MRVVMGGVASRHDLPVDGLDDIELAVETLLAEEPADGDDLELQVSAVPGAFRVRLAWLRNQGTRRALSPEGADSACEGCLLNVRLLLESLVDGFAVRDVTTDAFAVEMEKRIP